jgi:Flp pilus assembly protein TadG
MPGLERLRRFFSSDQTAIAGAASVELAIIAPVLVAALICTVDLGFGIYRSMQVEAAAQAGANYAVVRGFTPAGVTSAIASATSLGGVQATPAPVQFCGCASAGGIANAACGQPCPDGTSPGTYVTVSAQANYTTLLPYPMFPNTFVFAAQSTVRTQ